jgi:hypothetical protein
LTIVALTLVVILGGNLLLVAVALGAYGGPAAAPPPGHYALELLAAAAAAAGYLDARRLSAIRARVLAGCGAATAVLLLGAAILEERPCPSSGQERTLCRVVWSRLG